MSTMLTERCGLIRESTGRVVEVSPIAICVECMAVVRPERVRIVDARGWCHYRHAHPLAIVRLKRRSDERSVEYTGATLPDWLRLSI